MWVHTRTYAYTHNIYIHLHIYIYIYIFININIYIDIDICIYIHITFCEPRYYTQSLGSLSCHPCRTQTLQRERLLESHHVFLLLEAHPEDLGIVLVHHPVARRRWRPWHTSPSHSIPPCLGQKKTKASSRSKSCRKKPTIWRMCKAPQHSAGQLLGHFCWNSLEKNTVWCIQKNGQVLRDEKDVFLNNQMGDLIDQNMGCKHDFHFFWIWRPNMRIARCHPDWRETNWRSSVQSLASLQHFATWK